MVEDPSGTETYLRVLYH